MPLLGLLSGNRLCREQLNSSFLPSFPLTVFDAFDKTYEFVVLIKTYRNMGVIDILGLVHKQHPRKLLR